MSGTFGGLHDLLKQITTFLSTSLLSLWNTFLAPLGMALIHLFIGIMKGVWHGPFFGTSVHIPDGVLGVPVAKKYNSYPFSKSWKPPQLFVRVVGTLFGLGVGFRMYTQMLLFVMRASWFGAIPEYLNTQDGLWSKLPDPVYKTVMARIVGAVIGMVVGFRFFANALVLMAKGFFFGFDPIMMHCADGMLFKLNGGFPKSFIGKAFGLLFGFGIGFYPFINFLTVALRGLWFGIYPEIFVKDQHLLPIGAQAAYSTVAGRIVGGVAGGFLGLFGLVNTIFLILWGFFYGAVGDYHLKGGVLGKPVYPLKSVVGRAFGCIFGLYFGFRTFLDVSLTFILHFWKYMSMLWEAISKVLGFIYRVILRNLGRIFKFIGYGIWYGYAPMKCHLQDGLLPSLSEKDCDIAQSNVDKTCMSIGAFLGMGVGLRAKCNFITMIPRASWHGPLSPDLIIDDGFPCLTFPKKPLKTVVGKVFGVVFGLGLGFRSYTKVLGILMRGGWYGAFPTKLTMKDGLLLEPPEPVYKTACGLTAGWLCGLAVGCRSCVSCLTVLPKGMWLGVAPDFFTFKDAWLKMTESSEWESPFGRATGLCGLIVGFQFFVNAIVLILQSMWIGCVHKDFFFKDGVLGPPRKVMTGPTGVGLGAILGFGIGWRSLVDFFLMGLRSSWYGRRGRLYKVFPPNAKLRRNLNGSLSVIALIEPTAEEIEAARPIVFEATPLPPINGEGRHTRKSSELADGLIHPSSGSPGLIVATDDPDQIRNARKNSRGVAASSSGAKKIHPQGTSSPETHEGGRKKSFQVGNSIAEESFNEATKLPGALVLVEGKDQELTGNSSLPMALAPSTPQAVTIDMTETLPSYGVSMAPSSKPMSAATIVPPDETNIPNAVITSQAEKMMQMHATQIAPENTPPKYTGVKVLKEWWSKPNELPDPVGGRPEDEWLTQGATTLAGNIAGPIVLGTLFGLGAGLAAWYAYIPSNSWTVRPDPVHYSIFWWYSSQWYATFLIGASGTVLGILLAVLGIRNAFNPLFYSRTVLPGFITKVWQPALLPTLELIAVLASLSIYLPIMCVGATIRRLIRSVWYLIRAIACGTTGVRIPAKEHGRHQPLRITGGKITKSLFRVIIFAAIVSFMTIFALPVMVDRGGLHLASGSVTVIISISVAIPILDIMLKWMAPSYRTRPIDDRSAQRLEAAGLTRKEAVELNGLMVSRIGAAKMGGNTTDPAGPLRIWIRIIGLWAEDEVRLKKIHNVLMGWNHMPNSEAVRRRSPGEENGALGSSELVMIRGLDAESQRKVAEARTRRSSSVPKNGLPNPSAEMHRGSWSRRVSEVLMPGLATYRRNSEIGNQLGYFTDKLSGRPLGELFEVENRYYRLVLEANDKLWIWTWNGDLSQTTIADPHH